jgi:hypothetical protein
VPGAAANFAATALDSHPFGCECSVHPSALADAWRHIGQPARTVAEGSRPLVEETTRQNLIMAFNNVLRTSALVGVVDFQRAALAFGTLLEESHEGVIELAPLQDFLVQQGGSEHAVAEVLLFMKSREARFGVKMNLPTALAAMTPEQVDSVLLNFMSRGANSGTRAGQSLASPSPAPSSSPSSSSSSSSSSASAPPDFGGGSGSNEGGGSRRPPLIYIVFGVVLLAGIVNFVVGELTRKPPPTPLALTDPAGLPCLEPIGAGDAVVCYVTRAFYDKEAKEALDARAQVTKAAVAAKGYKRILVLTKEDAKLQRVVTW